MNWRKGFFRLWLVLAVLWWGGWGVYYVNVGAFVTLPQSPNISAPPPESIRTPSERVRDLEQRLESALAVDGERRRDLKRRLEWTAAVSNWPTAVFPPFAVLILGWALAWMLSGFKRTKA